MAACSTRAADQRDQARSRPSTVRTREGSGSGRRCGSFEIASAADWNPPVAEQEFKRALELDPKNADARIYYAHLLSNQGKHDEAFREASSFFQITFPVFAERQT